MDNGIGSRNDEKQTITILNRREHRSREYDVKVHPQPPPPAKVHSDNNTVYAMGEVPLQSGRKDL